MPNNKLDITIRVFYGLLILWGLGYWYSQSNFSVILILFLPYFVGASLMLSIYLFTSKVKRKKYKIDGFIFLMPLLFYICVLITRMLPSSSPPFEDIIKNDYEQSLSGIEKQYMNSELRYVDERKVLIFHLEIDSSRLLESVNEQQNVEKPYYLASQLKRLFVELPERIILNRQQAESVLIYGYWDEESILNLSYKKNGLAYIPTYPNSKLVMVVEAGSWTLNDTNNRKIHLPLKFTSGESNIVVVNRKAE